MDDLPTLYRTLAKNGTHFQFFLGKIGRSTNILNRVTRNVILIKNLNYMLTYVISIHNLFT